jgi:isopenicillin-N N-acyltransferase-like protein
MPGTVRTFISAPAAPAARGEEFGSVYAAEVGATVERYAELFSALAGGAVDLQSAGEEALRIIAGFSPDAAAEIRGIAGGARQEPWQVAVLNARTEILARLGVVAPGECSTIVDLRADGRSPVTMQTWDWHEHLADSWLAWTIEFPSGEVLHTITEFGQLAKIGVGSRGVGLHLNILNHASDGGPMGVPIHVLSRTVLERAASASSAAALLGAAPVSASSVFTLIAASSAGATVAGAELAPAGPRFVLPSADGLYLHTNHFLDPHLAAGDRAPRTGPDSFLRLDALRRKTCGDPARDPEELRSILADHSAGAGSTCCHAAESARFGDRWTTLATVSLDVAAGELSVRRGGPCDEAAEWHTCASRALACGT